MTLGAKYDRTLFYTLQITRSGIRPHVKWPVSPVIADGRFDLPRGYLYVWVNVFTSSHPRVASVWLQHGNPVIVTLTII